MPNKIIGKKKRKEKRNRMRGFKFFGQKEMPILSFHSWPSFE